MSTRSNGALNIAGMISAPSTLFLLELKCEVELDKPWPLCAEDFAKGRKIYVSPRVIPDNPVEDVIEVRRKYQILPFPKSEHLLGGKVLPFKPATSNIRQYLRVPNGERGRIGKGSAIEELVSCRVVWIVVSTAVGGGNRNAQNAVGLNRSEPTRDCLIGREPDRVARKV